MPRAPDKHRPPAYTGVQRHIIPVDDKEIHRFYTSTAWRRLRRIVLSSQPLCVKCLETDRLVDAQVVDHIIPIAKAPHLKLVRTNLAPMCHHHHNIKRATEDKRTDANNTKGAT